MAKLKVHVYIFIIPLEAGVARSYTSYSYKIVKILCFRWLFALISNTNYLVTGYGVLVFIIYSRWILDYEIYIYILYNSR